jgi:hypothetical protein
MCVGHPAEKLDQIDVVKGFLRPTAGTDRSHHSDRKCRIEEQGIGKGKLWVALSAKTDADRYTPPDPLGFFRKLAAVRPPL